MSKNSEIADLNNKYVMNTYQQSIAIVRGDGCRVWDADGMQYLDFTGGIAVQNAGHCNPRVVKAVQDQMATLNHCSNLFFTREQGALAQKLVSLAEFPGGKCFFGNSGAEANEAMIKLARLWGHESGRYEIITMVNSFHGRTLATAAATGQSKIQEGFDPMPLGFAYAEFNNIESVKEQINERTVAVMIECVQGEGGVIPVDKAFITALRKLCDEKNLLLLCDEVQCGMGRTGDWFAWQTTGVTPDAFSLAKSLASGLPIGACVAGAKLADVFTPGKHGSTFGGNPLSCAAALATISVIEDDNLLDHANEAGEVFRESLLQYVEKYDQVLEVRGTGLMIGLVLSVPASDLVTKCREMGLLACLAGPNTMRFLPPLTVKDDELEEALDMIDEALDMLYGEGAEEE